MPARKKDWAALKEEKAEFGDYVLAQAVAGLALDEIVAGHQTAHDVAQAFEQEYARSSIEEKEVIRIGIFEEMCVLLRAMWADKNLYEEKKAVVFRFLGPQAKRCFEAWEQK